MLNEERLSGKILILSGWMDAIQRGDYLLTPKGLQVFGDILKICHTEALTLEAMAAALGIDGAPGHLAEARANVRAAATEIEEAGNVLAFRRPAHSRT